MLTLVSAEVTREVVQALSARFGGRSIHVPNVARAVDAMSADERKAVAAVVVEADPVGADVVEALPSLELIACLRGTPVNVDIVAATRRAVPVVYTPGRNASAVADFTLGLLLATLRNLAIAHHQVISRILTADQAGAPRSKADVIWRPADPHDPVPYHEFMGPELSSVTVAVIGYGEVGRAVSGRLHGLVRAVLVVDPLVEPARIQADGFDPVSLDTALASADVITLHAKSPTVVIGRTELSKMRPGGYLINTARASVLDHEALASALRSGHLRGAAIDVFPEEPLPSTSPLLELPRLTVTPHIAGASESVATRQSDILLDALPRLYDPSSDWGALPVANADVRPTWRRAGFQGGMEP